jgi:hypothetical protein
MAVGVKRVVVLFDVLMAAPGPVAQAPVGRM